MLRLPYRFVIPLPVRYEEVLDLTDREWQSLDEGGLITFDLPPEHVAEAMAIRASHPSLSPNDCFCLVSTHCHGGGILLTGDGLLRRVATAKGLRVHGVLWIVDELRKAAVCGDEVLISALRSWREDPAVFLPRREIELRLRRSG